MFQLIPIIPARLIFFSCVQLLLIVHFEVTFASEEFKSVEELQASFQRNYQKLKKRMEEVEKKYQNKDLYRALPSVETVRKNELYKVDPSSNSEKVYNESFSRKRSWALPGYGNQRDSDLGKEWRQNNLDSSEPDFSRQKSSGLDSKNSGFYQRKYQSGTSGSYDSMLGRTHSKAGSISSHVFPSTGFPSGQSRSYPLEKPVISKRKFRPLPNPYLNEAPQSNSPSYLNRSNSYPQNNPELSSQKYPVKVLKISYGTEPEGLPDLAPLYRAYIPDQEGRQIPLNSLHPLQSSGEIIWLDAGGLRELSQLVLHYLKEAGLEGMVALVDPKDIDPFTGQDLRNPQDFSLDLQVWVARVYNVRLEHGEKEQSADSTLALRDQVQRIMDQEKVLGQPLRTSFRKSIKRLGRTPSRSSRLLLLPSDRPGEIEALVQVKPVKSSKIRLGVANSGSPSTGEWLINGKLSSDSLFISQDQAGFAWMVSHTGERYGVKGNYLIPLVQPGVLDLEVGAIHGAYDGTSFALTPIDFEGSSVGGDLILHGHPLSWENENQNFGYQVGISYQHASAYNSIFMEDAQLEFILPQVGITHQYKGSIVRSLSSLLFQSNISSIPVEQRELFGGFEVDDQVPSFVFSHTSSLDMYKLLVGDEPDFGDELSHNLLFHFRASGALSDSRMLPSMQSILGGNSGVRGYPEACVAGDRALYLSMEYRWNFFKKGSFSMILAPFLDYAQTYLNDPLPYESENTLVSWGIGLGMELPLGGQARLDFAKPLNPVVNGLGETLLGTKEDDYRVHASSEWKF